MTRINQGDIITAIRRKGGVLSAPEIAAEIGRSTGSVRNNIDVMVKAGTLIHLGVSATGGQCFGVKADR